MKKIFLISLLILGCLVFQSCGDDEAPVVSPEKSGTMMDKEGNEYKWVRLGKMDWMAENLKCGTPFYEKTTLSSWGRIQPLVEYGLLEEVQKYAKDFGNYYTYREALDNCPDGWRLPTDDDWKYLEQLLGMSSSEASKEGWRSGAGNLMIQKQDQGTGLELRYGGELCKWGYGNATDEVVKPYRQYEFGMYWTATKDESLENECVWYRKIMSGKNEVERRSTPTFAHHLCVRYVRDAE